MASLGQTSTQARQSVQRPASTVGRRGAGDRARVGQVIKQAPQAVQAGPTRTVTGPPRDSPEGSPSGRPSNASSRLR